VPDWLLLIVISLAVYRVTRLLVKDTFPPVLWLRDRFVGGWRPLTSAEWELVRARSFDPKHQPGIQEESLPFQMRDVDHGNGEEASRWVEKWSWVPEWLSDLLSCPWCASGWVSLAVVAAVAYTVGVPAPVLVWPAVWAAGSLLAAQKWS
jgi:hypothetical protein